MSNIPTPEQLHQAKQKRAMALQLVTTRAAKLGTDSWDEATDGPALENERRALESAEQIVNRLQDQAQIEARAASWRLVDQAQSGQAAQSHQAPAIRVNVLSDGAKDKNFARNYRLGRVLEALVAGKKLEGLEAEAHTEGVREMRSADVGSWSDTGGVMIPSIVSASKQWSERVTSMPFEKRDLVVGTAGSGGYTVATDLGELIPFLDPDLLLKKLGATYLTDLVGNLDLPRRATRTTSAAVAEQGALTESSPTFTKLSLSPKRQGTYVESSLQLIRQSSVSVENMLRADLVRGIEDIVETYAINGSGASNQPTGILATVGIGSVVGGTNGAVPDWADVTGLEYQLAVDNALRGKLGYLTTPGIANVFKNAKRDVAGNNFIWEGPIAPMGEMNGYRSGISTIVPSTLTKGTASGICHAILFGNWSELIIAMWGGLEIVVDPYSLATTGSVRYTVNHYSDVGVRHAESFAAMVDALLS